MTNGCICCTLREDLLLEVANLAKDGRFDYLLIESTGISEPAPVADTFTFAIGDGIALSEIAELDTMVTVVDGANFLDDLRLGKDLHSVGQAADEEDQRTVADLLTEQVEFANIIILNKMDLIEESKAEEILAFIEQLNPHALKLRSSFGKVEPEKIMGTGRFDFEIAKQSKGWQLTLRGDGAVKSKSTVSNSFVYRSRRPFHPQRFFDRLSQEWNGVLRSKGFFWLLIGSTKSESGHKPGGLQDLTLEVFGGPRFPRLTGQKSNPFKRRFRENGTITLGTADRSLSSSGSIWTKLLSMIPFNPAC